jgi:hypothetical protein
LGSFSQKGVWISSGGVKGKQGSEMSSSSNCVTIECQFGIVVYDTSAITAPVPTDNVGFDGFKSSAVQRRGHFNTTGNGKRKSLG